MAAVAPPAKFPVGNQRILWGFGESSTSSSSVYGVNGGDVKLSMELEGAMLSDTVFRFLDESPDSTTTVSSGGTVDDGYGPYGVRVEEGNEDEEDKEEEEDDNRVFWESHHKLLKDTMSKTSLTERSLRLATKETINEIQQLSSTRADGYKYNICNCNSTSEQLVPMGVGIRNCKNCLMFAICQRLRTRGYTNTAVYQTKWRSNHDIPSGEHKFIIVRTKTSSGDDEEVIIIEVRFKAEFEMGIAKGEYSQLMERVPTVFVGKVERMKMVMKILCSAAKKWCKENKVHLGPWRKHKFMYAKWFHDSCRKVMESGGGDDEGLVVEVSRNRSINNNNKGGSMLTAALNFLGSNGNDNSLMRPKAVAVL